MITSEEFHLLSSLYAQVLFTRTLGVFWSDKFHALALHLYPMRVVIGQILERVG